jgi:hypothetical protein
LFHTEICTMTGDEGDATLRPTMPAGGMGDQVRRRAFIRGLVWCAGTTAVALVTASGCSPQFSDPGRQIQRHRIGFIAPGTETSTVESLNALRGGLADVGYVEGESIALKVSYADGREERFPDLAAELVPQSKGLWRASPDQAATPPD